MPSVANVIGTDLSRYKLISKGLFACNPMHVGRDERLPIALYEKANPAIVSPAYFMFEIIDRDVLNEEYLMMWFRRPEFDRECWFMTDGSVRGGITWDDLCRIKLPVPSYARQCEIVESYRAITDRIALKRAENDNLEATGLAIFKEKFSSPNDGFDETPLYDLAEYINGTSFSEDEYSSDGLPIIKIAELKDGITSATQYFVGNKDTKYLIHDSDVLFSWSGNPDTSIDAFIWSHGDGILNQHTFRMVPRYGVAFTYFMLKFCKPEFVKAAMGKQTTGFANEVLDDVAEQLAKLLEELKKEKDSFKGMGIDYEEKAFYDILKAVAKKYEFEYPDDKMIELSKRIKIIVDDKAKYTDWSTRDDIKANLQVDLILLLDEFDYPPVTIDDVYKEVLEQAENFKKYAG